MLIMNDTTAVNNIFEKEYDDMNVAQMVTLLCKYYTKKEGLSPSSIKEKISNFLKYDLHRKDFDDWGSFVDKSIQIAEKSAWREIEYIPITEKEINFINSQPHKRQKILFTIIVLGKFYQMTRGSTWINDNLYTIFQLAHISHSTAAERDYIIHDFFLEGIVSLPEKIDNTAFKVNCCDFEGECVFKVRSLKDLGLWWLTCNGTKKYKMCEKCGKLFIPTGFVDKYCPNHRKKNKSVKPKTKTCAICGSVFVEKAGRGNKSNRCPLCALEKKREKARRWAEKNKKASI